MNNCIEWEGAINSGGYPVTWYKGKMEYAHRVVVGAKRGEVVRHTCDNPKCINQDHLVIGTSKENSKDMVDKQRQAWGESAARSKLTEKQVSAIRAWQGYASSRKVAEEFNISKTNVLDIWNKKIWKYL